MTSQQVRASEIINNEDGVVTELDINHLVIEDDEPVDHLLTLLRCLAIRSSAIAVV